MVVKNIVAIDDEVLEKLEEVLEKENAKNPKGEKLTIRMLPEELTLYQHYVDLTEYKSISDLVRKAVREKIKKVIIPTNPVEQRFLGTWGIHRKIGKAIEKNVFEIEYGKIIRKSLPSKIYEDYPNGLPNEIYQDQVEKHYEELIKFADNQKSRLAYMILGVIIMANGGKMTEALKEKILKYSDWKYEENQLINEQDIIERKNHLMEFRDKIKNYDGTKQVKTPIYTVTRVINEKKTKGKDITHIKKKNIDYSINE